MSGALDLFRLDGKVAVVTGGSKGIGMFYSQALAEAGADAAAVVLSSETEAAALAELEQLARQTFER